MRVKSGAVATALTLAAGASVNRQVPRRIKPAMSETTTLPIDAPTSTKWHPRASTLTVPGGCKLTRIELITVGTASNVVARAMITNLSLVPFP